ncbi:MAG: response regulator [Pseudomonadota bacterium]
MMRVLFVDDEAQILQGLRRTLRVMRKEWDMIFCDTAEAALQEMRAQPVDVVVSDIRMPVVDGLALLTTVREEFPDTVRIALSGHSGCEMQCAMVAQQFISKPAEVETLKGAIERARVLRSQLRSDAMREVVGGMSTLPSPPEIYQRVMAEATSESGTLARVGEIIDEDVGMSAKVLQLVNSAFFGIPRRIESVRQAATLLGFEVLRGLVLSEGFFRGHDADTLGGLDIAQLARDSQEVSAYARVVGRSIGLKRSLVDQASMAGKLHNVGKLVLAKAFPERYANVISAIGEGAGFSFAEEVEFGCAHPMVGGYLLGVWGLPDIIVEAVTLHNAPALAEPCERGLVLSVHLAQCWREAQSGDLKPLDAMDEPFVSGLLSQAEIAKVWTDLEQLEA